ncbi:MFS transporter [Advenella sp. FME57]|uniref:MFS transporter n=1 Tax=Advenella sp. FME57 TaxID=2742604 RepID=UPI0018679E0F|nr:MFS transporter [Advenella sp. FME57]
MVNPYRELFVAPGAMGFALAGLLARIALPMTGIGIITMLSQLRASYALAGAVSATFVLTYALLSPQISRLVDRHGQSRVLPAATMISVIGMLVLLAASRWQAPDWILFAGALLAGFMPSISAMLRARWTAIYRGQPQLSAAYSLETVIDEATYIVGPALSVGLSVAAFPQAGPLAALVLLVLGVWALTTQRGTEPQVQVRPNGTDAAGSVIRLANVRLLILLMAAMGVIVGTVDIVSVALTEQLGQPAAASLVLAAYAVGSFLAGLLFGAMKLRTPLHRLLLLGGLATAVTTLPLMLVDNVPALAATVFLAGLFFAPTMIVAMTLVERLVPARQLTEGMTWLLARLNVGVALGAVASGRIVDESGAQVGFAIALCAGILVLLVALLGHLRLRAYCQSPPVSEAA